MSGKITFTMIKPDAVSERNAGAIIKMIEAADFKILAMKLTRLTRAQAAKFYAVHKDKPFYDALVDFMSSGKIIAMVVSKDNAVQEYRNLIGATDPAKAETGTIRKLYASSVQANAVHGADSDENAIKESAFFFSSLEFFEE